MKVYIWYVDIPGTTIADAVIVAARSVDDAREAVMMSDRVDDDRVIGHVLRECPDISFTVPAVVVVTVV